jgi:hypothetical protein
MDEPSPAAAPPEGASTGAASARALEDRAYAAAVVELLGAVAYGEISAFERLAQDARMAPRLEDKAELAKMAAAEYTHYERLRDHLVGLGADPMAAMAPFAEAFDAFHSRTASSDWLEGLVTAYVGDGLAADFYSEIARDHRIAGRLALWGRRLMGEALTQAQRVAVERDALTTLLTGGVDRPGLDLAAMGRLFTRLTENHTKRMESLGLDA